jgi:uncharacterized Zn-finger protein
MNTDERAADSTKAALSRNILNSMQEPEITPPLPAPDSKPEVRLLECPYCHAKFELTWKLYFKQTPFNKLRCPYCRNRTKIKEPWWSIVITAAAIIAAMAPIMLTHDARENWFLTGAALLLGGLVGLNVNRYCSARFGVLTKTK